MAGRRSRRPSRPGANRTLARLYLDVSGRSAGQNITAGDLVLPRGATLVTDSESLVIGFLGAPTAEALEAELAEAEAEAGIEREEHEEPAAEGAGAAEATGEGAGSDES